MNISSPTKRVAIICIIATMHLTAFASGSEKQIKTLEVLATAYNSVPEQTDDTPFEAAWGDILTPDMQSIAVSKDLLDMGLKQYSKVKISGLPGEFVVLDKMHSRWEKKIDIYMGTDIDEALQWGIKKVKITWEEKP